MYPVPLTHIPSGLQNSPGLSSSFSRLYLMHPFPDILCFSLHVTPSTLHGSLFPPISRSCSPEEENFSTRSLCVSATKILSSPSMAIPPGFEYCRPFHHCHSSLQCLCPLSYIPVYIVVSSTRSPSGVNFWMRLFNLSATQMFPSLSITTPVGLLNVFSFRPLSFLHHLPFTFSPASPAGGRLPSSLLPSSITRFPSASIFITRSLRLSAP